MKILIFISQIYLLGGAERLAVELAEDINHHKDVSADVLVMTSESIPGTEITKARLLTNGVPSVRFLGRQPRSGLNDFIVAVRQLRKILVDGDYDVVETSLHGPAIIACWAVWGLDVKHMSGIHALYQRMHYDNLIYRFWRWSCRINNNTYFYAISQKVAQQWIAYSNIKPERIRVVYNSINNEFFESTRDRSWLIRELNLNPNHKLLLFVGRLLPVKGLDILIEAVKSLLIVGETSLLIIGSPNDANGETNDFVEQLKQKLLYDVPLNTVHWLGFRDDVPRLMASTDVLVHPARQEGFGLVLVEALATGLPVVSTNVGGIPEVLEGTDSIIVPADDPEPLRKAILETLNRSLTETTIAIEKGKQRAMDFRIETRTNNMLQLFEDIRSNKHLRNED